MGARAWKAYAALVRSTGKNPNCPYCQEPMLEPKRGSINDHKHMATIDHVLPRCREKRLAASRREIHGVIKLKIVCRGCNERRANTFEHCAPAMMITMGFQQDRNVNVFKKFDYHSMDDLFHRNLFQRMVNITVLRLWGGPMLRIFRKSRRALYNYICPLVPALGA